MSRNKLDISQTVQEIDSASDPALALVSSGLAAFSTFLLFFSSKPRLDVVNHEQETEHKLNGSAQILQ
jgi:hypothetical protein